jgi:hypothetical protein
MRGVLITTAVIALQVGAAAAQTQWNKVRTVENEDGYAFGSGPRDLFRLPSGSDQHLFVVEDTPGDTADNVLEISGLDPAKSRVSVEFGGELNLYWADQRTGVLVEHEFLKLPGHKFGVQTIHFSNGKTWTKAGLEKMLGTVRFKLALTPPETSHPSDPPSPRFALGHGAADHFRMHPGDGDLTILEIAAGSAPQSDVTLDVAIR